ncbi:MAG TPA: alpha/beta fold hydrolase [Candidatus Acidoferrum sp.]|jgi:hypothetical protein
MNASKLIRVPVYIAVSLAVLAALAGIFLAKAALHPPRRPLLPENQLEAVKLAQQYRSNLTEIQVVGSDGAVLRAWHFRPRDGNGNSVILFHGISDNRAGMIRYAEIFLRHGYDVVAPDARAHGASGGDLATFGLRETDDIRRWLDWVGTHDHPACVYGSAESMGAAELLKSLESESRFCAVVAESPFATFREIAYDRMGQAFHTGPWLGRTFFWPTVEVAFYYAKWKYHLDFSQASPERAVASTKVPVLLIHGQMDHNIPIRHSRLIAAANHAVVLWEVPGADHCGAIGVAPAELEQRTTAWFDLNRRASVKEKVATLD